MLYNEQDHENIEYVDEQQPFPLQAEDKKL